MYSIKEFNLDDRALKEIWIALENQSDCFVFQSYEWIMYWKQSLINFPETIKFHILVIYAEEKPVCIFPLQVRKSFYCLILEFLGGDQFDYKTPLIDKNFTSIEKFKELWVLLDANLPKHDLSSLDSLPEYIGSHRNPLTLFKDSRVTNISKSINFNDNRDLKIISKRTRKDLARAERRLNERGSLEFGFTSTPDEFLEIIEHTILQKIRRYEETGARNILLSNQVEDFYRNFNNFQFNKIEISLSYLRLDSEILATHLGFMYKNRYYFIYPTFNDEYGKYSPGRILLLKLLEKIVDLDIEVFDLTVGAEDYKNKWSNEEMRIFGITSSRTLKGKIFALVILLSDKIKTSTFFRPLLLRLNKTFRLIK